MDTPESVLAAFVREGWKAEPFERVLSMVRADASQAVRLLVLAVEQNGKDATFHIVFPMSHLEEISRPSWLSPRNYPSWSLPPLPGTHRFGGTVDEACACCGNPLHNLVSLSGSIDGLSLPGTDALEVVTCLSCLGWSREVLFFRHDSSGHAHPLPTESCVPEFPANGLKEVDVLLARSPRRWRWQDWALSNGRENLHRVGGHPTWVQSADYPQCPDCGARMKALLQLDSELPTVDGEEWDWGSGGICYVFCCSRCSVTASLWQCT